MNCIKMQDFPTPELEDCTLISDYDVLEEKRVAHSFKTLL